MLTPKTKELMKLINRLAGYDYSTRVEVGYMPAKQYSWFGDSDGYNEKDWGFVVSTKLCMRPDVTVHAQGKELDEALEALAKAIVEKHEHLKTAYGFQCDKVAGLYAEFIKGNI